MVVWCRVCVFRVRVWNSSRAYTSFGYGYGSLTELTKLAGRYESYWMSLYPSPSPHSGIFKRAQPYPGYCATRVENLQKFRVRTGMNVVEYGTYRSSGTGNTGKIPRVWFCAYDTLLNTSLNSSSRTIQCEDNSSMIRMDEWLIAVDLYDE